MCGQPVGVKLYHMVDLNGTFPFSWRREKRNHYLFQWRNLESEYLSLVQPEKHSKDSKNTTTTPATYDYLHDPGVRVDINCIYSFVLHAFIMLFFIYLLFSLLIH
ncbi:unnamed protein product [Trichobilharzia regenti]|nr:unnamed protein product [Trichobilharzia regenti]